MVRLYAGITVLFMFVLCLATGNWRAGAEEKDFAKGAKILLLGDSLLTNRVDALMQAQLKKLHPDAQFEVVNLAFGGMFIGPLDGPAPQGVSKPLIGEEGKDWYAEARKRCPKADAVIILFAANDGKAYTPEDFGKKLAALCDRIAKDYPDAKIIPSSGMYLDPAHSGGYSRQRSMVKDFKNGESRNKYLAPYYDEARKLAKERGYKLAEVCLRIKAETEAGNWDFRIRAGGGDPKNDDKHKGDVAAWFGDIHPNNRGVEVIADVYVKTLLGQDALKPFGAGKEEGEKKEKEKEVEKGKGN